MSLSLPHFVSHRTAWNLALIATVLLCMGCSPVNSRHDLRARTNLDHWNALDTTLRQVNAARHQGSTAQLEAIRLGIETLDRLPTDKIDSELLALNASLRELLQKNHEYLAENAPLAADPTDHPGPFSQEEAELVEEGIRVQLLLTDRYRLQFPTIFERTEHFDQQSTPAQTIDPVTTDPVNPPTGLPLNGTS